MTHGYGENAEMQLSDGKNTGLRWTKVFIFLCEERNHDNTKDILCKTNVQRLL